MALDRISRLEDSLPGRRPDSLSANTASNDFARPPMTPQDTSFPANHSSKRRREESVDQDELALRATRYPDRGAPIRSRPSQSASLSDDEAENTFQDSREGVDPRADELGSIDLQRYLTPSHQHRQSLHGDRRRALQAAIGVAKKVAIMQPKPNDFRPTERFNFYDAAAYPTAEFMHTILDGEIIHKDHHRECSNRCNQACRRVFP